MKRTRLSYDEWSCIISKDLYGKRVSSELLNGYIGLINIKEISQVQIWRFRNIFSVSLLHMAFNVCFLAPTRYNIIIIFLSIIALQILLGRKNNHSPRLAVTAEIVSKRIKVSHHSHANAGDMTGAHGYHTTSSTRYYVTFQVESGDRIEFTVTGSEYGMLAEGDRGKLSFQGTRYLSFERS